MMVMLCTVPLETVMLVMLTEFVGCGCAWAIRKPPAASAAPSKYLNENFMVVVADAPLRASACSLAGRRGRQAEERFRRRRSLGRISLRWRRGRKERIGAVPITRQVFAPHIQLADAARIKRLLNRRAGCADRLGGDENDQVGRL